MTRFRRPLTLVVVLLAVCLLPNGARPRLSARTGTSTDVVEARTHLSSIMEPPPPIYLPLIMVTTPIKAGFEASPTSGSRPLTVQFTNTSTGSYTGILWQFGDGATSTAVNPNHTYASAGSYTVTLAVSGSGQADTLVHPDYIAVCESEPAVENGSFEEGWTDLPPVGYLINQQPNSWTLSWLEPGEPLYDDPGTLAAGVPECRHLRYWEHLPPHQWPGEPGALVLDGEWTYKMFHAIAAFGSELRQTVGGLEPGSSATVIVPVNVHRHDDPDPWAAEVGVWLNGQYGWVHDPATGQPPFVDQEWIYIQRSSLVPPSGQIEIVIRFKDKWGHKDFFIDAVQMFAQPASSCVAGPSAKPLPYGELRRWLAANRH